MPTKLTNIWIETEERPDKPCIRLDWDNDRHHRVQLNGTAPEDVIQALEEGIQVLREDLAAGNLISPDAVHAVWDDPNFEKLGECIIPMGDIPDDRELQLYFIVAVLGKRFGKTIARAIADPDKTYIISMPHQAGKTFFRNWLMKYKVYNVVIE